MQDGGQGAGGAAHRVVVLGGGFGGLRAVRHLRGAGAAITLVDRRNHHLFQPLLYQVATGALSPADISAPLRHLVARRRDVQVVLGEAVDVDPGRREVILRDGERIAYDTLVVACGARPSYFGRDAWERVAPGLKGLEDATRVRSSILLAFERAERERDPRRRARLLTFAVVGGGPTGVELAGAIAELARDTLRCDFRAIDPRDARVLLVEAGERILSTYDPRLSRRARADLERLGVEVLERTSVVDVAPGIVRLRPTGEPDGAQREVEAETVLWAAGVRAAELADTLALRTSAIQDRAGRIAVAPDLSLARHPEIFVIGDLAHVRGEDGAPLPGVAPVAMQQGRHVARLVRRRLAGRSATVPFRYADKGNLATIGRASAVAEVAGLRVAGLPAWLLWLFVHILYLVGFANRTLVLFQWGWNYLTRNRTARLITQHEQEAREAEPTAAELPRRQPAGSPSSPR